MAARVFSNRVTNKLRIPSNRAERVALIRSLRPTMHPPDPFSMRRYGLFDGPNNGPVFTGWSRSNVGYAGRGTNWMGSAGYGHPAARGVSRGAMALKEGVKAFVKFLPVEFVLGGAFVTGGAMVESANWGSQTGLEEDYVGGAIYGATKEFGGTVGSMFGSTAGAIMGQALIPIPALGALIGGFAGGITGYNAGRDLMDAPALGGANLAVNIHRTAMAVRRLSFGVDYRDNQAAYTMRQRAVQEMSGSLLNARQYLGNESMFLHG